MKERPILFSAPMVRAVLAGTKTQTRRLVKPRVAELIAFLASTEEVSGGAPDLLGQGHLGSEFRLWSAEYPDEGSTPVPCPYGAPGDRLWVRETFYDDFSSRGEQRGERDQDGRIRGIEYRADHDCRNWEAGCPCNPDGDGKRSEWRPSIFLPRWASRIDLEVTSVRVEQLQAITEADARAEGVGSVTFIPDDGFPPSIGWMFGKDDGKSKLYPTARGAFEVGWDSINGERGSWASNPFVWVVSFRRVEHAQ